MVMFLPYISPTVLFDSHKLRTLFWGFFFVYLYIHVPTHVHYVAGSNTYIYFNGHVRNNIYKCIMHVHIWRFM